MWEHVRVCFGLVGGVVVGNHCSSAHCRLCFCWSCFLFYETLFVRVSTYGGCSFRVFFKLLEGHIVVLCVNGVGDGVGDHISILVDVYVVKLFDVQVKVQFLYVCDDLLQAVVGLWLVVVE